MDKRNTLLLTVIAVATLLVAVMGATFAYFTAQTGNNAVVPVKVTTTSTDSSSLAEFGDLVIAANQQNFGETGGVATQSLRAVTSGYVAFTANSSTGTGNYCYEVEVEVSSNNFEYSLPKTFGENTGNYYPELIFNVWKVTKDNELANREKLAATDLFNTGEITDAITVGETSLPYVDSIITANKVCDTNNSNGELTQTCQDSVALKGYDITVLGNTTLSLDDVTINKQSSFKIPASGNDQFEHKISITGTSADNVDARSSSDYWKATVTFINYSDSDIDGDGIGDQQKNTDKTFRAQLKFTPKTCSPGA